MTNKELETIYSVTRVNRYGAVRTEYLSGLQMITIVKDHLATLGVVLPRNASLSTIHQWLAADEYMVSICAPRWKKQRTLTNPMLSLR